MVVIALDIGTTKICAVAINADTGAILETVSEANEFLPSENPHERIQDSSRILKIARNLCANLIRKHAPILCIGITGQMHGIVYLDHSGEAIGSLYTWQDQCGNLPYKYRLSYAEYLTENSGYKMASGYGLTTCFYHTCTGQISPDAHKICTIHDYVAMCMTGRAEPLMHASNAASLGFFDLSMGAFDKNIISHFGMNADLVPVVTSNCEIIGETEEGIPVCVAIGDNQSSFLGSVGKAENSILLNIGTGSQISVITNRDKACGASHLEIRPYLDGKYLLAGSPLCGGRAYALLENFFRAVISMAGLEEVDSVYPQMNALLTELQIEDPLIVSTRFSGTRTNPHERGKIENIGFDNFTPAALIAGFAEGMAQELYELSEQILTGGSFSFKCVIAAGNGVRKNPAMRSILSRKFGLPVKVPLHHEEAAYGAALFAMTSVGRFRNFDEAQRLIRYT